MMAVTGVRSVAEAFWVKAGGRELIPRRLESAVLRTLPLAILKLPELSVSGVKSWLRQRQIPLVLNCADRSLRACLLSYAGRGVVLIDGADPDDEVRFSLAHEVSHFLLDYLLPRHRALEYFGEEISNVLDNRRPATIQERADSVLSGVPIGFHYNLMEREPEGALGGCEVIAAESRADQLALELLAPEEEVKDRVAEFNATAEFAQRVENIVRALAEDFALPDHIARGYGLVLSRSWYGGPSFREWLGA